MSKTRQTVEIALLGDHRVGKSQLMRCYTGATFQEEHKQTTHTAIGVRQEVEGRQVDARVWDIPAGQENQALKRVKEGGIGVICLCYDVTNRESFEHARQKRNAIINDAELRGKPLIMVGLKADLAATRQVSKQEAEAFAAGNNLLYFEASSKNNVNVNELFSSAIRQYFDKTRLSQPQEPQTSDVDERKSSFRKKASSVKGKWIKSHNPKRDELKTQEWETQQQALKQAGEEFKKQKEADERRRWEADKKMAELLAADPDMEWARDTATRVVVAALQDTVRSSNQEHNVFRQILYTMLTFSGNPLEQAARVAKIDTQGQPELIRFKQAAIRAIEPFVQDLELVRDTVANAIMQGNPGGKLADTKPEDRDSLIARLSFPISISLENDKIPITIDSLLHIRKIARDMVVDASFTVIESIQKVRKGDLSPVIEAVLDGTPIKNDGLRLATVNDSYNKFIEPNKSNLVHIREMIAESLSKNPVVNKNGSFETESLKQAVQETLENAWGKQKQKKSSKPKRNKPEKAVTFDDGFINAELARLANNPALKLENIHLNMEKLMPDAKTGKLPLLRNETCAVGGVDQVRCLLQKLNPLSYHRIRYNYDKDRYIKYASSRADQDLTNSRVMDSKTRNLIKAFNDLLEPNDVYTRNVHDFFGELCDTISSRRTFNRSGEAISIKGLPIDIKLPQPLLANLIEAAGYDYDKIAFYALAYARFIEGKKYLINTSQPELKLPEVERPAPPKQPSPEPAPVEPVNYAPLPKKPEAVKLYPSLDDIKAPAASPSEPSLPPALSKAAEPHRPSAPPTPKNVRFGEDSEEVIETEYKGKPGKFRRESEDSGMFPAFFPRPREADEEVKTLKRLISDGDNEKLEAFLKSEDFKKINSDLTSVLQNTFERRSAQIAQTLINSKEFMDYVADPLHKSFVLIAAVLRMEPPIILSLLANERFMEELLPQDRIAVLTAVDNNNTRKKPYLPSTMERANANIALCAKEFLMPYIEVENGQIKLIGENHKGKLLGKIYKKLGITEEQGILKGDEHILREIREWKAGQKTVPEAEKPQPVPEGGRLPFNPDAIPLPEQQAAAHRWTTGLQAAQQVSDQDCVRYIESFAKNAHRVLPLPNYTQGFEDVMVMYDAKNGIVEVEEYERTNKGTKAIEFSVEKLPGFDKERTHFESRPGMDSSKEATPSHSYSFSLTELKTSPEFMEAVQRWKSQQMTR